MKGNRYLGRALSSSASISSTVGRLPFKFWEGFDQFRLPLGHADGLFQIAQRIFNGQTPAFFAQQQTNGRSVLGMANWFHR